MNETSVPEWNIKIPPHFYVKYLLNTYILRWITDIFEKWETIYHPAF